jgi:hypothetical protein
MLAYRDRTARAGVGEPAAGGRRYWPRREGKAVAGVLRQALAIAVSPPLKNLRLASSEKNEPGATERLSGILSGVPVARNWLVVRFCNPHIGARNAIPN